MREKLTTCIIQVLRCASLPRASLSVCVSLFYAGAILWMPASVAIDGHQAQLRSIQQEIANKEKRVQLQKQQRSNLMAQLQNQEKTIAEAASQLRKMQKMLKQLSAGITTLTDAISKLEQQQKQQKALLAAQLDAAFRQGQHNVLQMLLSTEASQRGERILAYFSYLNEARQQTMIHLQQTRGQLSAQQVILRQKQGQQETLFTRQRAEQQKLKEVQGARKVTLTKLNASLKKDQQQLAEMRENENQLRKQITLAEQKARALSQRETQQADKVRQRQEQAKRKGTTYVPTQSERELMARTGGLGRPARQAIWPVRGRIEHQFGEPIQGELRWKGLVIGAPQGSEVKAIADGHVLMADWLQGYGLVIVIAHGKGDMSIYGYNQSALVSSGAKVKAGQVIALVGSSGGRGSSSLYFEIRRQGQAVNPLPWLEK